MTLRSWWGKQWATAVELSAPMPAPRGKQKPRGAKLRTLDSKTGEAIIEVSTSSVLPYEVRVTVAPIEDEAWARAVSALGSRAIFAAKLLAGDLPEEVERAMAEAGASLFPAPGQVRVRCNCPAIGGGCRHGAIAERSLAEAIDRDPFLLFDLRGRPRAGVLAALGLPEHVREEQKIEAARVEQPPEDPALFRRPRGDLYAIRFHLAPPETPRALLTRFGDPPGWRPPPILAEAVGPAVELAATKARDIGLADE